MRFLICNFLAFSLIASALADTEQDIAIAMAMANVKPTPRVQIPTDPALAVAESQRTGKPLIMFIGCPYRPVEGYVGVGLFTYRTYIGPGILICVPNAGEWLPTVELSATATDAEIRQGTPKVAQDGRKAEIEAWLRQPLNHGSCPCAATGMGCHCNPHEDCARGGCKNHNPLLKQGQPVGINPTQSLPTSTNRLATYCPT